LKAVRAYQTQFPPAKDRVFRLIESHNRFVGLSAGFDVGEVFLASHTLGVKDLVQAIYPERAP
jgi:hypothetical protein